MLENYTLDGDTYSREEILGAAEAKGLTIEAYISEYYPDDVEQLDITSEPPETSWWRGEEGFITDEFQQMRKMKETVGRAAQQARETTREFQKWIDEDVVPTTPGSWGDRLKNTFNAYVNPALTAEEKQQYTTKTIIPKEEERKKSEGYLSDKAAFVEEAEKAFSDGELFDRMIKNPNQLTLQQRQIEAGDYGSPEEYLLNIVKEELGGMVAS